MCYASCYMCRCYKSSYMCLAITSGYKKYYYVNMRVCMYLTRIAETTGPILTNELSLIKRDYALPP